MGSHSQGSSSHSRGSSNHSQGSSSHYRDSSFSAPVFAPAAAPPPVAAPPPAPPVVPGVMTVAQLVQQPGREHLPYLTPCPKGRRQTWFNRSRNGISAWINNMMYSSLSKEYPTFNHFPADDQEMCKSSPGIPITRTLSVTHSSVKLWTTMGSRTTSKSRSGSSTRSRSRSTSRSGRSCACIGIRTKQKLPP
uniref:Uncharacterized protein n=1 Tax=Brassica oleracea var. oleracea TaxID=109376 RepID=A0A0D3BDA7_BRAOL